MTSVNTSETATQTPLHAAASRNPITCASRCASKSIASMSTTAPPKASHAQSGTLTVASTDQQGR
jgi:hypothetical protein